MLLRAGAFLSARVFPGGLTPAIWRVIGAGVLASLLVLSAALGVVWSNRQTQTQQWISWASNTSLMLAEHARQSLQSADLVLRAITDRVQDAGVETEEDFRNLTSSREMFEILRQRSAGLPQIDVATVVDLDGHVVNFSRWWPALTQTPPFSTIDLSDRDYFKAHLADPALETYVSVPVQNRGTGTWTFYLSRKVRSKSGQLLGIALTGIHVEFFADFYKAISGGTDRTFSLFRADGALMARYPTRDDYLGKSFIGGSVVLSRLLEGADAGTAVTTVPRVTNPSDVSERITSPRRVAQYPLMVNVIVADTEFLAPWRRNAHQVVVLGGVLALAILALTLALAGQLSRQHATMIDLDHARQAAETAARAKSDFLAMMSHEIRTPINAVIGMSDALLEAKLPAKERDMVRIVGEASSHLLSIVNTVLDFSRIEAGHDQSSLAAFELRRVVRTTLELATGLPGAARLAISSHVETPVPDFVLGDAGRITQILLNLMGNAVKFTEQGSVTLTVSRLPARSADAESGKVWLRFAIADTGAGISREMADRLFEPFERGEAWQVHKASGTGLGLAISKRLVTMMGGEIGADGEPGVGSVFWFELPLQIVEAAHVAVDLPTVDITSPDAIRPIDILVAEDSTTSQMVARHFLESMGHSVTIVENGVQAVDAVQRRRFDLVLMDGHMPEMDGLEATRRIRAMGGRLADLPIYGLSANVMRADRERAAEAGMNGYLTKPVRKLEIAAIIAQLYPAETRPSSQG